MVQTQPALVLAGTHQMLGPTAHLAAVQTNLILNQTWLMSQFRLQIGPSWYLTGVLRVVDVVIMHSSWA